MISRDRENRTDLSQFCSVLVQLSSLHAMGMQRGDAKGVTSL
jgi:hypothetical protein